MSQENENGASVASGESAHLPFDEKTSSENDDALHENDLNVLHVSVLHGDSAWNHEYGQIHDCEPTEILKHCSGGIPVVRYHGNQQSAIPTERPITGSRSVDPNVLYFSVGNHTGYSDNLR